MPVCKNQKFLFLNLCLLLLLLIYLITILQNLQKKFLNFRLNDVIHLIRAKFITIKSENLYLNEAIH
jgi:hypothetical protein